MNPNCVRKPDQIKLIMECRQSGLSDYQWCRKQGINPGTFYNWVSKLRKAGYTIPDPAGKVSGAPVIQRLHNNGLPIMASKKRPITIGCASSAGRSVSRYSFLLSQH